MQNTPYSTITALMFSFRGRGEKPSDSQSGPKMQAMSEEEIFCLL